MEVAVVSLFKLRDQLIQVVHLPRCLEGNLTIVAGQKTRQTKPFAFQRLLIQASVTFYRPDSGISHAQGSVLERQHPVVSANHVSDSRKLRISSHSSLRHPDAT